MKFTKESKGITLLALIITIIVLVVLAGVALNALFGNNGILNNAKYGTDEYVKSAEKEAIGVAFADLKMKVYTDDNITEITAELLEQRLGEAGYNVEVTANESGNFVITFKNTGDQYEVTASGMILGEDKTEPIISKGFNQEIGETTEFDCIEDYAEYEIKDTGYYQIECWGASGGRDNYDGNLLYNYAYGGYASGIIRLDKGEKIYVYVGKQGEDGVKSSNSSTETSYNGGGSGKGSSDNNDGGGAGGGATDIRLVSGDWDNFDSLKSRIMVAGGGSGGATVHSNFTVTRSGGSGGGLEAVGSIYKYNSVEVANHTYNATQTTGYSFGIGQNGITKGNAGGAGAGGGYYGGYSSTDNPAGGAGGGSGYISGYEGCNAISESSTENNITHTGQSIHYSGKQFINAILTDGNSKIPNVETGKEEIGHRGDGHARIIFLGGTIDGTTGIPVYTAEDIMKIGSGKIVYDSIGKGTYTYGLNKTYILQNDITVCGDILEIENLINTNQVTLDENGHTLIFANSTDPTYFKYSTTATEATITGLSSTGVTKYNNGELTELIFPNENSNGLPITIIGNGAFNGYKNISNIYISENIKSINQNAFKGCKGLTEVTIPANVKDLIYDAFRDCTSLNKVVFLGNTLPGGGTNSTGIFWGCSNLKTVEFKGSIPRLRDGIFANTGIEEIVIPSTVTEIGKNVFGSCTQLEKVTIPNSVTLIEEKAFYGCTALNELTIPDSVVTIDSNAFNGCIGLTGELKLPTGLKTIAEATFKGCTNVTSISGWDNVTSIGKNAFNGCTSLTGELELPTGLKTIGESAFNGCTNITSVSGWDSVTSIGKSAFSGCKGTTGALNLPSGLTTLLEDAFYNWTGITGVYIPKSLTNAGTGNGPFNGCSNLTSITFEEGITQIAYNLFDRCTGLTNVTIPNTVTAINQEAFCRCSNLTSITIPNSVTTLGKEAFSYTGFTQMPTMNGVTIISEAAFMECTNMTRVNFNNAVKTINKNAFYNCTGITGTLTLPNGLTTLLEDAFYNCTGITGVYIPKSLTNAGTGNGPFDACSNLTSVTFEEGMAQIIKNLFDRCTGLTSVTIPNTVTTINQEAFSVCSNLSMITIPNSVTTLGQEAFSYTGFIQMPTMNGVTTIGEKAFYECKGLGTVSFSSALTNLGKNAFSNCTSLTEVNIPNTITLGANVFQGCTALTTANFAGTTMQMISMIKGTMNDDLYNVIKCSDDAQVNLRTNNTNIAYIEATGTQYINSRYVGNQDTAVEASFLLVGETEGTLYGARLGRGNKCFEFQYRTAEKVSRFDYNAKAQACENLSANTTYIAKQDKNKYYLNNTYLGEFTYSKFTTQGNLAIAALNTNGTIEGYAHARIYYLKIWDNGTLIRDFVPVYNTTLNQAGLYDEVGGKFYGSLGTNAFVAPE